MPGAGIGGGSPCANRGVGETLSRNELYKSGGDSQRAARGITRPTVFARGQQPGFAAECVVAEEDRVSHLALAAVREQGAAQRGAA